MDYHGIHACEIQEKLKNEVPLLKWAVFESLPEVESRPSFLIAAGISVNGQKLRMKQLIDGEVSQIMMESVINMIIDMFTSALVKEIIAWKSP